MNRLKTLLGISVLTICSLSRASAKDVDVLLLTTQANDAGMNISQVQVYLDGMLSATPSYAGSSCAWHGEANVDSLQEAHYDPRHSASTLAAIQGGYDYVVLLDWYIYLRWSPEFVFEGVLQLSKDILGAGAEPILLMGTGASNADLTAIGENAYRVANGCGIQINPAGYALYDQGIFSVNSSNTQAYLVAASLYAQITGLSAADLAYAPVAGSVTLAQAADSILATQQGTTHYNTSRHETQMVRYRYKDLHAAPFNGVARYCYTGTSTEAGINSHLQPILTANGFTVEAKYVSASSSDTKSWTNGDFDSVKTHFEARDDQMFLAYARGAASGADQMIAYDQENLQPLKFDRHLDNIGRGAASTLSMLEDIEYASYFNYSHFRNYNWGSIPFHIGVSRWYKEDQSMIASSDGTHVTTPFYNMICSMLLTSALGLELSPSSAISANSQSLRAFQIGQQVVKELAYLSEDSRYVPDSQLEVSTEMLRVATTNHLYAHTLSAAGGSAPYSWEVTSSNGLPLGLTMNKAGVLSGTPMAGVGTHVIVCKVTDSNGAIRKRALKLLVQDHTAPSFSNWADFIFDGSGVAVADQDLNGDPDSDGRTNFLEFSTDEDPTNLGATSTGIVHEEGSKLFQFTRGQSHLRYTVESSSNLLNWNDVVWDSVEDVASLIELGGVQKVDLETSEERALFYRLTVTE